MSNDVKASPVEGDVRWISVRDKLPVELESVLVFLEFKEPRKHKNKKTTYHTCDTGIDTGTRFGKKGRIRWAVICENANEYHKNRIEVTHWMPLPKPPNMK